MAVVAVGGGEVCVERKEEKKKKRERTGGWTAFNIRQAYSLLRVTEIFLSEVRTADDRREGGIMSSLKSPVVSSHTSYPPVWLPTKEQLS